MRRYIIKGENGISSAILNAEWDLSNLGVSGLKTTQFKPYTSANTKSKKSFGDTKVGNFLGQNGSQIGQTLGALTAPNNEQGATREAIRSGISSAGPIGAIIGAASGVVDAIGSATGLNLDSIDKDAAKDAGIGAAASAQNFINSLPGVSAIAGIFGGKTKTAYKSDITKQYSDAFSGTSSKIDSAMSLSNKRMLFGKRKANRFIREQNKKNQLITNIGYDQNLQASNISGDVTFESNLNNISGYSPQLLLSRKGMKFPELDYARKLVNSWSVKPTERQDLQKFQLGGKMNLIPEGALHARKHNLEKVNPELEGQITTKGIPVVAQGEGGIIQQAEIEKEEVVFRKEFTDKLESLYKQYQEDSSDDVAIEAGKLICYELLKNTDDRSGLIKSIE